MYNDADETKAAALYTLKTVLIDALKLLHPYMPFITEEIYCTLMGDEEISIMVSELPKYKRERVTLLRMRQKLSELRKQ